MPGHRLQAELPQIAPLLNAAGRRITSGHHRSEPPANCGELRIRHSAAWPRAALCLSAPRGEVSDGLSGLVQDALRQSRGDGVERIREWSVAAKRPLRDSTRLSA